MIKLTGEQERIVFLPERNPVQIKGVAGSGKTTVAIFRARHLAELKGGLFDDHAVAIFTFTKSLVAYMDYLCGEAASGFTCVNFDKWVYGFLNSRGKIPVGKMIKNWEQKKILEEELQIIRENHGSSASRPKIFDKPAEFFLEEFSWIKGKVITCFDDYANAQRIGRGVSDRVTSKDRFAIWEFLEAYNERLRELEKLDWEDLALLALTSIEDDPQFEPPFFHIVVDEAQDLPKAKLLVLTKLVSADTNSITIVADAAQQIYKSGFSWREVGLNVAGGRSVELKQNYRNTEQIYRLAQSLLDHEPDKTDFTEALAPRRSGEKPKLMAFKNEDLEFKHVVTLLREALTFEGISSCCLLHRTWHGTRKLERLLHEEGVSFASISGKDKVPFESNSVFLSTMSSVKGLEFDAVFITGASSEVIPRPLLEEEGDEESHVSTERRLFYTAMTRARKILGISYSGAESVFINELDESLIQIDGK